MRKNLLASVTSTHSTVADGQTRSAYVGRGASRSMMLSIEEMAEDAKKLTAGEAIVALDPALIDNSFVADRVGDDEAAFLALRSAIEKDGQLQPILVRPHPAAAGRFMVVFGHRRTRAARELGISVRAVVRDLEEISHIVAQGQENSRRSNLSFIEKALFARKLQEMGQSKDTVKSALGVDDTLLSRMLSVLEVTPSAIIEALGSARSVGRDRWEELKKSLAKRTKIDRALSVIQSEEFLSKDEAGRFNFLLSELKRKTNARSGAQRNDKPGTWASPEKAVDATFRNTGKTFSLSLSSRDASEFGRFISSGLDELYRAFKASKSRNQGD